MRAHLFISTMFAASLFVGAASADRPGEDGGRTSRVVVREMPIREVREPMVREAQPQVQVEMHQPREPQAVERLRALGDMVDRSGARPAQSKASSDSAKAQRQAQNRRNEKKDAVINCAPTDDMCTSTAKGAPAPDAKAQRAAADKQRQEIQKMVEKVRAEKLRAVLMAEMCEKMGNMCAERL